MSEVGGGGSQRPVHDGGSHGRHERLHEACECGGGVFDRRVCFRVRIFRSGVMVRVPPSSTNLLSVFVALLIDGGSDKM